MSLKSLAKKGLNAAVPGKGASLKGATSRVRTSGLGRAAGRLAGSSLPGLAGRGYKNTTDKLNALKNKKK